MRQCSIIKKLKIMTKKVSKKAEQAAQQVENVVIPQPTVTPHLIVAQRKFDRWYVYFQGVAPKDNVGCGCKTAKSALRYMHLLKHRYGAVISQNKERFSQPELDFCHRYCTCYNCRAQRVSCRSYPFAFVNQKCASPFRRSDIRERRTPPPLASEQGRSEFRGQHRIGRKHI